MICARGFINGNFCFTSGKIMLTELEINSLITHQLSVYAKFFVPSLA